MTLIVNFLFTLLLVAVSSGSSTRAASGVAPAVINTQLLGPLNPLFIELNNKLHLSNTSAISDPNATQLPSAAINRTASLIKQQLARSSQFQVNSNLSSFVQRSAAISEKQQLALLKLRQSPGNLSLSTVRQRWHQMELSVGDSLKDLGLKLRTTLDELAPKSAGLSLGCRVALQELIDGLAHQRLWASQVLDASARLPSGLLEGTLTELGHFDQCLGLTYHPQISEGSDARRQQQPTPTTGQYCSVQIKPPLVQRVRLHTICQRLPALSTSSSNFSNNQAASKTFRLLSQNSQHFYYAGLRLGLCTPSKCSKADLQLLLNAYLAKFELLGQVKSCQVLGDEKEPRLDSVQQYVVFTLLSLVLLVALGTIVDLASGEPDKIGAGDEPGSMESLRFRSMIEATQETTDSVASSSRGSRQQGRRAPNGKRWLYQVYRSPPAACYIHQQPASPGMQRNPLASDAMVDLTTAVGSGSDGLNNKGQILGGQFSTLHSSRFPDTMGECHLKTANQDEDDEMVLGEADEEQEEEEEEAWIAQLERNQAQLSSNANVQIPSRKMKQKRLEFRVLLKAAVICFSLRSNLRLICKHVASSSSSGGGGSKREQASRRPNEHGRSYFSEQKPAVTTKTRTRTLSRNELADVKVIHGLRTITMIWIIFGHTIGLVNPEMMNNLFGLAHFSCSSRLLQALLNATLAVNTFFMISGLVTVISLARKCDSANRLLGGNQQQQKAAAGRSSHVGDHGDAESSSVDSASSMISSLGSSSKCISGASGPTRANKKRQHQQASRAGTCKRKQVATKKPHGWPKDFQPLAWLALRYLRLTPAYAATIGLSILMPLMGSGPFWQESAGQLGAACRENWWSNFIYANNFINTDRLCLIHSWYLSNDWQFFILAMLLLGIGYKSKRFALVLFASLLIGSSAATFALTVANDFPPTIVSTSPAVAERWLFIHSLYYKPWPHLSSYLIGLLTGYMLVIRDRINLSKTARILVSMAATVLALALLNSIYPWNMGLKVEPLLTGLHSATFRTLWAACCAWLVFALATRPQSSMAKLLAWQGFQVSSRLTYCAYLIHPLIIYYHFGTLRERMDSSVYGQLHRFIATLGLSYLFALLLSLMVESPSIQLQRLLVSTFLSRSTSSCPKGSEHTSSDGRRHRDSSSSGTSNSWIGTSSFGEQSSATSSNLALVTGNDPLDPRLMHLNQPTACCHLVSEPPQKNSISQHQTQSQADAWNTANDSSAAAATDADFQRKLAQAISRGFRLRSKLANGTIKSPNMALPTRQRSESGQMKRLMSTAIGAVPTPIVVEKTAIRVQEQEQQQPRLTRPISHHTQAAMEKPTKKVEFSTFFVGHPPQGFNCASHNNEQQLAMAAVAERQRRRSHDLMMATRPHQPPVVMQHPLDRQRQQQPAVTNEMMPLKQQQAALLTRSQNQLDQFNPRNGKSFDAS